MVFTWGNPARGDDAIGPEIYETLLARKPNNTDILTDYQLQIEHAQDLIGRRRVIFVDAGMLCDEPYEYCAVNADQELCYTTHAMTPASLLQIFESTYQSPAPESYLLTVRGYEFNLGAPLSDRARNNMQQAVDFLLNSIQPHKTEAGA